MNLKNIFREDLYMQDSNIKDKKYRRFLELCEKSIKVGDIKPGLICYGGYTYDEEIKITSLPYISKHTDSPFVDCMKKYTSQTESNTYKSSISLCDRNIVGGGYNLYRLFYNLEDSKEYCNIKDSYTYWDYDEFDGGEKLNFTIKPIPSKVSVDDYIKELKIANRESMEIILKEKYTFFRKIDDLISKKRKSLFLLSNDDEVITIQNSIKELESIKSLVLDELYEGK